ncbi:MAG: dockerin type I repeat-containing protein [Sodaliphilus sp.]
MKKYYLMLVLSLWLSPYALAENEPFLTKVYDFLPAPGQFVNAIPTAEAGNTKADILARVAEAICGRYEENDWGQTEMIYKPAMVSLGSYGGYVVVGFDHPVVNVPGVCDFQIFGNAFLATGSTSGGSSEPGIVMVSYDINGNGIPDDPWYELAGSEYNLWKTQHNYTITYYKPDENKEKTPDPNNKSITDLTYVRWTSNDINPDSVSGYVYKNSFHAQSYWPQWAEGETLTFSGSKLCNNASDQSGKGTYWVQECKDWGYVDNRPDYDPYATASDADTSTMNMGFNIDWAVDADGVPVHLPMVHFIKIYNAMNQYCGWLGETSTEVAGGVDYHPEEALPQVTAGDVNGSGVVDVSDVTAEVNLILGTKPAGYNPVVVDLNGDQKIDVSDITALVNVILE